MAVVNVVCPHCGKEVKGTIPRDGKLHSVQEDNYHSDADAGNNVKCAECNSNFVVNYTR